MKITLLLFYFISLVATASDNASKITKITTGIDSSSTNSEKLQAFYQDFTKSHLPPGLFGQCMDADAGDADGDGDLDLVLAMEFKPNILLLNDGSGHFTYANKHLPADIHDSEEVEFADFDGDGDLDLIFVSEDDKTNEFYLNQGKGNYVDASDRIPIKGTSNAHAVLDLDNDGDLDILIANIGSNRVLINDGFANFSDQTNKYWLNDARTQDLELIDVDGDGDLDVISANEGQNELFLNHKGKLRLAKDNLPEIKDETREIKSADVDNDGDLDLLVANVKFMFRSAKNQDYLLLNDGHGIFTIAPDGHFPLSRRNHFTIQFVDLDGDKDIDILAPHSEILSNGAGDLMVLLNDGKGIFGETQSDKLVLNHLKGNTFDIEVSDFNGDGQQDLFFCNRGTGMPGNINGGGGQAQLLFRIRSPSL